MARKIEGCDCQRLSERRADSEHPTRLRIWYQLGLTCQYHREVALPVGRWYD